MSATPAPEMDLSEFIALGKREQTRPCKVALMAEQLPEEDRERFLAACADRSGHIPNGAIHKWLAKYGYDPTAVTHSALTHHRQRDCLCYAEAA